MTKCKDCEINELKENQIVCDDCHFGNTPCKICGTKRKDCVC